MAITRRQFVTRLGALAGAVGFSQAEVSKLAEAFAGNSNNYGPNFGKPRVIWIHGAECTGCSTSLLGILEDATGNPFAYDSNATLASITTLQALGLAGVTNVAGQNVDPNGFTIWGGTRDTLYGGAEHANIADVVIDVIDLQYHETVMNMGGDLAAKWLQDFRTNGETAVPFVLVVEGALQDKRYGGAWNDSSPASTAVSWCSVGKFDDESNEQDMPEVVTELAVMANCAAIMPIGQCACYGGYPGCKPQITSANAGFDATMSQTGAKGTYDFLSQYVDAANPAHQDAVRAAAAKVINTPGCPTNPWWFVLSVVMVMLKLAGTDLIELDYGRRIKKVYPGTVHSAFCPRYPYYAKGIKASRPGQPGCLQNLGCKGIASNSLCGRHGWNNQQPENAGSLSTLNRNGTGGHCTTAGHPCMACTEKGYPDSFVPFVKR